MCILCGPDRANAVVDHSIEHSFKLQPGTDNLCGICNQHLSVHPDKMEYLAKREMDNIIEYGHEVRVVFPDEDNPGFAYSIGRTVKDRPELLVVGSLPPNTLGYIVNRVAELDDERELRAGQELDTVLEGYNVRLVMVADLEEAQMFGVTNHFSDATALQILWPDKDGRFPGEPGYEYGDDAQPVYS